MVLRRRSLEVDVDRVAGDRHRRAYRQETLSRLEHVLAEEASVRQLAYGRTDDSLGVGEELVHRRGDSVTAPPLAKLGDAALGEPVSGQLGPEVAAPLVGVAHPRDERLDRRVVQTSGRDDDALLVERPRRRAGGFPARSRRRPRDARA